MPESKLRILFVEASEDDVQQVLSKLGEHGFQAEHQRVDSADSLKTALPAKDWDIVLCSYNPPAYGGLEALALVKTLNAELPFLFLSHNLREENIIQAIQAGAGDYIYKGNLNRLVPAIDHYLREAAVRRENRQMLIDLKENQARLHGLISNLPGLAFQILLNEDNTFAFPYVSEGCQTLFSIPATELQNDPSLYFRLLYPDDLPSYQKAMQQSAASLGQIYWEGRIRTMPDETIKWVNLRCSPRKLPQGTQWECVMFDITERKQAEIEILRSQEQLRELSAHIQDVREEERLALAREVHDDMGSMLTAIKLDLAWLSTRIKSDEPSIQEKIRGVEELVSKCAAAAGNISRNLRPSALDSFGIVAAIEIEVNEFTQRTGISCTLNITDEEVQVDQNISISLFRILQETLNNIMKHAQASKVKVSIANHKNIVSLTVSDNGRGLNSQDRLKPRSFGLRGIQERVARFGGEVKVSSNPGKGTTISVSIPHAAAGTDFEQMHQQTLF